MEQSIKKSHKWAPSLFRDLSGTASINNAGDIVFSWYDSSGNGHGALRMREGKKFKFYEFSDPKGPDYTKPDGINDKREIVGRYEQTGHKFEQSFEAKYSRQ